MNLLTEIPPDFIEVGRVKIKIKTDFALWVKFLIAVSKQDNNGIVNALGDIFGEIPANTEPKAFITAINEWLWQCSDETGIGISEQTTTSKQAFDFEVDGNIIYCELWEYFPRLMERGISFPEGMELIKMLISNENTVMHHRAFARCGDFSRMDKDMRTYWQKERAKYAIKAKQADIDAVFSGAFM